MREEGKEHKYIRVLKCERDQQDYLTMAMVMVMLPYLMLLSMCIYCILFFGFVIFVISPVCPAVLLTAQIL